MEKDLAPPFPWLYASNAFNAQSKIKIFLGTSCAFPESQLQKKKFYLNFDFTTIF